MAKRRPAPAGLAADPRIAANLDEYRHIVESLKAPGAGEFDVFDMFKPVAASTKIGQQEYGLPKNANYIGGDTYSTPTNNPSTWAKYAFPAVIGGGIAAGLAGAPAAATAASSAAPSTASLSGAMASPGAFMASVSPAANGAGIAGLLSKVGGMNTNQMLLLSSLISGVGSLFGDDGADDQRESYTGYGVEPNSQMTELMKILHGLGGAAVEKANKPTTLRSSYMQPVSPVTAGGRTYGSGMAVDPAYKDPSLLQSPGANIPTDLFADPRIIGSNRDSRDNTDTTNSIFQMLQRRRGNG